RGLRLIALLFSLFGLFDFVFRLNQIPPHPQREKDGSAPPGCPTNGNRPGAAKPNSCYVFFSSTTSASMMGSSLPSSVLAPPASGPELPLPPLAFSEAAL